MLQPSPLTPLNAKSTAPTPPGGHSGNPRLLTAAAALVLSVLLLTLAFPPFYLWPALFFAITPLSFIIVRRPLRLPYLLLYLAAGFLFFAPNLFWLAPITAGGYLALALFLALYFPLYAFALHRLVNRLRLPATFAVPLAWTALEYIRGTYPLGGFAWFSLGTGLAPATHLLQAADLFGVWGLTFLLAAINGFWVDLLRLRLPNHKPHPLQLRLAAFVALLLAAWIAYGFFRLHQDTFRPGPRIAVIQDNIPQAVKDSGDHDTDIFEKHFALTVQAASASPKPDLVAWPETMLPGWTNPEFLDATPEQFKSFEGDPDFWLEMQLRGRQYLQGLQRAADKFNTSLLLGAEALVPRSNINDSPKQNRVLLLQPHKGVTQTYSKVHLVPFGEFLPWRTVPILGNWMLHLSPYGFDYSCTPGTQWTRFSLQTPAGLYTFGTPVCFEDAMPQPAREMTMPRPAQHLPKADFLVNISNDGWFFPVELDQHLQATQLRAVENRVPIARAVNTGNSGFVDSSGRVLDLVHNPDGLSHGAVGTLALTLQLDSRITLYSLVGDLLPVACAIAATLLIAWTFLRPRRT